MQRRYSSTYHAHHMVESQKSHIVPSRLMGTLKVLLIIFREVGKLKYYRMKSTQIYTYTKLIVLHH